MKFLNTPWRVEREAAALIVVDCKNLIVASFSLDADDLPGTIADEEAKAYGLAKLPETHAAISEFLEAMADPVKQLDEALLSGLMDDLEGALASARPPKTDA